MIFTPFYDSVELETDRNITKKELLSCSHVQPK